MEEERNQGKQQQKELEIFYIKEKRNQRQNNQRY